MQTSLFRFVARLIAGSRRTTCLLPSVVLLGGAVPEAGAEPVAFRNDVMAVLSKAGCNQGTCHGNQNGKGGFKLSLRGDDPAYDYEALTREMLGRRTDPLRPTESLLLLKATAQVPHEGGKRFAADSLEYSILQRWIAAGLTPDPADTPRVNSIEVTPASQVLVEPADRVQFRVRARFDDGSERDVTRWAIYEPSTTGAAVSAEGEVRRERLGETAILVRYLDQRVTVPLAFVPARPDFQWPNPPQANFIDGHIFAKQKTLRVAPSELCSDAIFVRRTYLDVLGLLPTAAELRAFVDDQDPDKRRRLVDQLLRRPEFADYWALKWADLLRVEEQLLDRKGVQVVHQWLRQSINEGKPLNELARELIAGRGSTYTQPTANFYRALRDPQTRAEATAQVFLGIRLQCARCHNHPSDRWTQDDYYGLAAFFARVGYRVIENRGEALEHEYIGEQVVYWAREGELTHGRTGVAAMPRLPDAAASSDSSAARLQTFADWVASPDNPFFARAQVNRIWYHLLGRGIVDPIDDFRASNPPVNGPLLDELARDFVAHGHDLRHTIRTVMASRTYQLSSSPNATNRDDETNFSHVIPRPLPAEVLLDALTQVLGVPAKFTGHPPGLRAVQLPGVQRVRGSNRGVTPAEKFLEVFGKPARRLSCECERAGEPTLAQVLQLVTGELVRESLRAPDNRIGQLLAAKKSNPAIVEELYLSALGRSPSATETQVLLEMLASASDRRAALEDLAWGLVTSKEFWLRR
jgi:hypothetical protein